MSRRDVRNREKNRKARREKVNQRADIVQSLVRSNPNTSPMEKLLLGISWELGLNGVVNDDVRMEATKRLQVLEEPIVEQVWNWREEELDPSMKAALPVIDVPDKVMVCDLYEVWLRSLEPVKGWPATIWLSIKRRFTKESVHDWRHLQKIKNDLVGNENEGVELYPAESRLVDTANQYHLFVLKDATQRFPFGFRDRLVSSVSALGAEQRPFNGGGDNG